MPTGYATSDATWKVWVTSTNALSTNTLSTADSTWQTWMFDNSGTCTTSTSSITQDYVWQTWSNEPQPEPRRAPGVIHRESAIERLLLQNGQKEAERARKRALAEQDQARRAENRARILLEGLLNPEERRVFDQHEHVIISGRNNMRYRVRKGRIGNIDVVNEKGIIVDRLCVHPVGALPDYDVMAAQVLGLRFDEERILRTANKHGPPLTGIAQPVLPALH